MSLVRGCLFESLSYSVPEEAELEDPNFPESHVPSSTQRTTGSYCFRSKDAPEKRNKQHFGHCLDTYSRKGHWLQERGQEASPALHTP